MRIAFDYKFPGKGVIKTKVNKVARGRKHKSKEDIIHVLFRSTDGEYIMDADITPEEAVYFSNALLSAFTIAKSEEYSQ